MDPVRLPSIDAATQLETTLQEPPQVEYIGIDFVENGSDFTRQALQVPEIHDCVYAADVPCMQRPH